MHYPKRIDCTTVSFWEPLKLDLNQIWRNTGSDNSIKICFGRKTKLFRESGDFAGNQETRQFLWEIRHRSGIRLFYKIRRIFQISGRTQSYAQFAQTTFVRVVSPRMSMRKRSSNMCRVKGIVRGRRFAQILKNKESTKLFFLIQWSRVLRTPACNRYH